MRVFDSSQGLRAWRASLSMWIPQHQGCTRLERNIATIPKKKSRFRCVPFRRCDEKSGVIECKIKRPIRMDIKERVTPEEGGE